MMLSARTGEAWRPAVEVISERRTRDVDVSDGLVAEMLAAARELASLADGRVPRRNRRADLPGMFLCAALRAGLMETLFVSKDARLSADGGTLLVRTDDAKRRVPIKGLGQVVLAGEAGLTTSVIGLLGRNGVRITVLDWHGNVVGILRAEPQSAQRARAAASGSRGSQRC